MASLLDPFNGRHCLRRGLGHDARVIQFNVIPFQIENLFQSHPGQHGEAEDRADAEPHVVGKDLLRAIYLLLIESN